MTKRQREEQRKQRLLAHATELDAQNDLVAGRTYRIENPHHLEHGRLAEITFTPGAALRHAVETPAAWTIWSGWCPGQAIVKVDGRTSWVAPDELAHGIPMDAICRNEAATQEMVDGGKTR